ncbi:hypothetical protein vBAspALolek_09 [Aeromonas phage vB_AspA_Lolek]|nr:hypothetical protein vBAspALolek_09 [Aeromonas phage vB_AspA_Lolek]
MRDLVHVDAAILGQRIMAQFEHPPGTAWRTNRDKGKRYPHRQARVTYQPVNPWDLTKRLERPYHVFINGSAQMSYVSLEAAVSHLIARGFNPLVDPVPLYPSETDVSATAF